MRLKTGQRIYVEVKPSSKLANVELKTKLRNIDTYWKQHGCYFIVITDEELNQPARQSNLSFLRSYLSHPCSVDLIEQSRSWLSRRQAVTFLDLAEFTGSLSCAYSLLAQENIQFMTYEIPHF
ncbi:hypothetical protein BSQ33_08940 [Vibrio gazogenes]|uniref:TnsA endonuclease N-terminal domain-containing protein n=1 Tax=Vibrio gazogenes TaxID=687 RepID=A0A1Z2SFC7_VIBGA|nr:hypothetical protein BSQ33_08940 [Vibrio gazogenes]